MEGYACKSRCGLVQVLFWEIEKPGGVFLPAFWVYRGLLLVLLLLGVHHRYCCKLEDLPCSGAALQYVGGLLQPLEYGTNGGCTAEPAEQLVGDVRSGEVGEDEHVGSLLQG